MKFLNESLTFLFELLMLAAFFFASIKIFDSVLLAIALAIVVSAIVVFIWGNYLAPNGKSRVSAFWGLLLTTMLSAIGPITFYVLYPGIATVAVAAIYLVNRIGAIAWKQW